MNQRLDRALEDARQCNLMYSIDPIQLPNEDFRFSINGVKGVTGAVYHLDQKKTSITYHVYCVFCFKLAL